MYYTKNALSWLGCVIEERYGLSFVLREEGDSIVLRLPGNLGAIYFDQLQSVFHKSYSEFSCQQWQASKEGYKAPIEDMIPAPSEYELPDPLVVFHKRGATIHYDILGLTYWMLTRIEEIGYADLDEHQRFPASASHAYQYGYLERPLVDEWLIILGQVIQRVWPTVNLLQSHFEIKVSHDVDSPSQYGFKTWPNIGRIMAGHLIKRRDLKAFFTAPYIKAVTNKKLHPADPFNTFDWLMDISDLNNLTSSFYFICGQTDPLRDADYTVEQLVIRNLMSRIYERGHEIGLHPSYGTFQNPELIEQEASRLKRVCAEEGIKQDEWGGRMHYLKWAQPITLKAWADAGMSYDSTLGYADKPGFRCGTCHDYPAFDPIGQEEVNLRVRPLIAMECTIISSTYLGLENPEDAFSKFSSLKQRCKDVSGCFTLLWHNSFFYKSDYYDIYRRVIGL